jgi:plastocyanin
MVGTDPELGDGRHGDQARKEHSMTIDATSAHRRLGADSDLSTQRRRRRPRWWVVLLAAVAAVVVATVVVIQLLPNAADGPPVVGATQVAMRGSRFHPPVIQIKQGQTVTWSFNDGGVTHNVKGTGWGSGDQASGTFRHTFGAPGSYRYSCTLHLGMNGRVDVGPGPRHDAGRWPGRPSTPPSSAPARSASRSAA